MKLPNGPQSPAFVQMLQWIFQPMAFMEACAKRYGDIFTMQLNPPVVFVSNPQALQQILTSDTKEFAAPSDWNTVFEPMLGKNSVITVSGEVHRRQRQLLMPPFHGDRMRTYGQVINDVTQEVISQWQIDQPFCVRSAMQKITMRVIMQAVFGLYAGPRAEELEEILATMLNESSPLRVVELYFPALRLDFGPRSSWGRFLRRKQRVHQLLNEEIQERRENPDSSRTDILSLLMAARDEAGEAMTDEELRDELMTLLTAGHETTATALTWALYWIHKSPSVQQKLLQELDSLGENPDPSSVFKSPYLSAVCSEALRIYPVGMLTFPRVVKTPVSLCGHNLEPGTVVLGSIYLTHQREDLYPQHQQFKPERFLERQFSPYEFLPFGGGARRCIGMAFAQFEMKIVLAKILSSWELALIDNGEVRPKRRGLVTGPNRSIQMVAKKQHQLPSRALESSSI
ncbi:MULTISPECIES: cytochrome P450 [unclassified Tolypothrix]|uniref:cytochrome P450 n=1 Tax=unclassified Tolypothrix TaxID=2649714 RepID=UPI0005EAB872|nr:MULTISPECIES: cytochrome P450 [unclassified Tolypothrix]BAY95463.1 cytochrome P450 [Microchaete diplosiphon NIES-3275]EKF00708.1 cytochrome P450 [Tolypothrix sp. PCC 7601]MBE9084601.1 cytochrome P450 [Tolypothrix sp. LEGE 11397]UYD28633.1 cytochrome P450 [Tolypothrix sp. PCC 7712]UYD35454.1 cytochrome P450 [Tolypothrix sp. PCC 7601]